LASGIVPNQKRPGSPAFFVSSPATSRPTHAALYFHAPPQPDHSDIFRHDTVGFFLIRLVPGDPIETLAGERGIDAERHAALLKEYGLDRPSSCNTASTSAGVLQGDLGKSIITHDLGPQ
jgi:hypothetical protein